MQFKDITGQIELKDRIIHSIRNERLPHAILFSGKAGHGTLPIALATVQYIFCENPSESDACGECSSCSKVSKLIHPDLHFTVPAYGPKAITDPFMPAFRKLFLDNPYINVDDWIETNDAENKQWNITAEECLHIIKNLNLQAFEGKWKVQIVWMGEYLGHEGNRLLKLIEEPPDDTIFIIIAEDEDRILNTVMSRCQVFKVPPLYDVEIEAYLLSKGVVDNDIVPIIQMASGDLREAILLIERQISALDKLFLAWLRKSYQANGIEMSNWVDEFSALNREEQKKFIQYGLNFLHELLLLKMTGQVRRLKDEEKETAIKLNNVLQVHQINEICNLLNKCGIAIERYANTKLLMLDGSIQLKNIFKLKKADILAAAKI